MMIRAWDCTCRATLCCTDPRARQRWREVIWEMNFSYTMQIASIRHLKGPFQPSPLAEADASGFSKTKRAGRGADSGSPGRGWHVQGDGGQEESPVAQMRKTKQARTSACSSSPSSIRGHNSLAFQPDKSDRWDDRGRRGPKNGEHHDDLRQRRTRTMSHHGLM